MTNKQIQQEVWHIFQSGANETRVCNLIQSVEDKYRRLLPEEIIGKYSKWTKENPDEDYQYDEIHDFLSGLSRGDLVEVMESLLQIKIALS